VSYKPTTEEKMQIIGYLASPAGERVLREIDDKTDEYRVRLKIPEPGGIFKVKLPAGSIRDLIRQFVGHHENSTPSPGIDTSIDFPPSWRLTKQLIAQHPEFITQTGIFRVIDIQNLGDRVKSGHS
jgi:hypothetical protein